MGKSSGMHSSLPGLGNGSGILPNVGSNTDNELRGEAKNWR